VPFLLFLSLVFVFLVFIFLRPFVRSLLSVFVFLLYLFLFIESMADFAFFAFFASWSRRLAFQGRFVKLILLFFLNESLFFHTLGNFVRISFGIFIPSVPSFSSSFPIS